MKFTTSVVFAPCIILIIIIIIICLVLSTSSACSGASAHQLFESEQQLIIENDQDVLKNSETDIKKSSSFVPPSSSMTTRKPFFRAEPFRLERGPWPVPSPFLFCVYHKDIFPKGYKGTQGPDPIHKRGRQMGSDFSYKDGFSYYHGGQGPNEFVPGFPAHPHRGLSTITITLDNCSPIDHFDSTGAHGRYHSGDTQYMCAFSGVDGKGGIQHSEMFACTDEEKENVMELFQIWIKIPNDKVKGRDPMYKMFWREQIPVVKIPVEGKPDNVASEVKVIVGDYPGLPFKPPTPPEGDYAADPLSQATVYVAQLPTPGASIKIPPMRTATCERSIYVYIADDEQNCKVKIEPTDKETHGNGGTVRFRQGVKIAPDCEVSITNEGGSGNIGVLVLAGEPLKEPTVSYGPFVGKDMGEIEDAFANYRRTQFGGWPWPSHSPVHKITDPRMSVAGKGKPIEYPPGYTPNKE